jgi:hypothetical protein
LLVSVLLRLAAFLLVAGISEASPALTARPEPEGGGPTQVEVLIWLVDLHSIDSSGQTFTANVFVALRWRDPRLAHANPGPVRRELEEVWHPRAAIANEVGRVQRTMPEVIEVEPDGSVISRQRYLGQFSQALRVDDFPFDRHTFRLHIVSTGFSPDEVAFVADPRWVEAGLPGAAGIADDMAIPDWEVDDWRTGALPYHIAKSVSTAGWVFEFEATRKSGYYVWKVILPLILIVGISWSVFWIDPENAGTEVGVATTSMLTLIAYRFAVDAQVPRVPYLTRLDLFISGSTVLVFLTLIEVVLVVRLFRQGSHAAARWMDRASRVLFPLGFGLFSLWTLRG